MGCICCKPEEIDFSQEVELSHFFLLRVIGKGAYGKVRIVQHKNDDHEYALKYISKAKCIELNATKNILLERQILEQINYPLVVNLRYAFHDDENLFMALDLMLGGDMRFHLDRLGSFSEIQVRFFIADLILSLHHIHGLNIIHRDVKPDNILLDSYGNAHLSDFNIATQISDQNQFKSNRAGSLFYMAPEILLERKYSTGVDWWSLGVTMYELLFGKRPFNKGANENVTKSILYDPVIIPDDVYLSDECLDVLKGFLERSPEHRYGCGSFGFEFLKSHPWFRGLDWQALENKTAIPLFVPNKKESNFDTIHELEDLLFEDEPLRISKKSNNIQLKSMKELIDMDTKFLPYDYTKHALTDMLTIPAYSSKTMHDHSLLTTGTLLKRVGDTIDYNVYKSQGYHELKADE